MKFDFKPLFSTLLWIILFAALAVGLFCLGLVVGYSVLGDGRAMDVFDWSTWQHILNFLK